MSTTSHPTQRELPHADDELMTLKEVATLVRVPEATPRYWRHLGTGPHGFRIGRSVRYWRNDVVHWLEEESRHPRVDD
jgi:predicted DNA-binding transcriptional regulator AlpA